MKINYKILWIDDNHRYVRGDKRSLKLFLESHGIKLEIVEIDVVAGECPTETDKFKIAISDIELDMVFVDFNMPEMGDKIIQHIRRNLNHYHLPILFYTSDGQGGGESSAQILQKIIFDDNIPSTDMKNILDGIYYCDRDDISEKAVLILNSLLKREAKAQRGRGLLLNSVSEIDATLLKCMQKYKLMVPNCKQDKVTKEILKRVRSRYTSTESVLREITDYDIDTEEVISSLECKPYEEIVDYLISDHLKFDTFTRASVLREMLKYIQDYQEEGNVLSEFFNKKPICLNGLRNSYAHKSIAELEKEHDDNRCKFIREESRKHLENIQKL